MASDATLMLDFRTPSNWFDIFLVAAGVCDLIIVVVQPDYKQQLHDRRHSPGVLLSTCGLAPVRGGSGRVVTR